MADANSKAKRSAYFKARYAARCDEKMKVEAIALSDFVHGDITAAQGQLVRHRDGGLLDSGLAGDLERAGLVRVRVAPMARPQNAGKVEAAGADQPSSSSPAAQVSQQTTLHTSKGGGSRSRKADTLS